MDGYVVMLTDSRQDAVARMSRWPWPPGGCGCGLSLTAARSPVPQQVAAYGTAVKLVPEKDETADAEAGEQSSTAAEGDDQPMGEEDTIRSWPPSSWPSNEPGQQSAGSAGEQR